MVSTIQFLKNYSIYSSQARYHTAQLFLRELQNKELKPNNRKLMMLRIIEEYISSTEDLAMWLSAVSKRIKDKKFDLWELLLLEDVPNLTRKNNNSRVEITRETLNHFCRLRSASGLLKSTDLIPLNKLVFELKKSDPHANKELINESLDYILRGIKASIASRKARGDLLVRAHNKIKHGMMVYLDPNEIDCLWMRDLKLDKLKRKHSRNFELRLDEKKAKEIVGNIEVISHAIQGLIQLVLVDFRYRIENGNMRRKTKEFWINELNRAEL